MESKLLTLAPQAAEAFNATANELVGKIIEKEKLFVTDPDLSTEFIPKAVINAEKLEGEHSYIRNYKGEIISYQKNIAGKVYAIENENCKSMLILVEKIFKVKSFYNSVSQIAIIEALIDWLMYVHLGENQSSCTQFIINKLQSEISMHKIFVPVHGLVTKVDFNLGLVKITSLSQAHFDRWYTRVTTKSATIDEDFQRLFDFVRKKYQGNAACEIFVEGEIRRATEIG